MSGAFEIRAVGLPWAQTLATLHGESFGKESWSCDQIRGSLALTTTKAWAAFEGDTAVAFILLQILADEAEILTFCVSPSRRKQKIGGSLLKHMLEAVRQTGTNNITLEVAADNKPARTLYERHGFTIIGTRANYYKRGAVTVDGVLYGYQAG